MPKRIYEGSHAEVEILLPGGQVAVVKKGETGDFPDELVGEMDAADCWGVPKTKAKE